MGFGMPNPGGDWYKAARSVPDRAKDPARRTGSARCENCGRMSCESRGLTGFPNPPYWLC